MSEPTTRSAAANLRAFIEKYWPDPDQGVEAVRLYNSQPVTREIGLVLCDFAVVASRAEEVGATDANTMERMEQLFRVLSVSIFVAVRKALEDSGVAFPVIKEEGGE